MLQRERNDGNLVITSTKLKLMIAAISCVPEITRLSYLPRNIVQSFARTGIVDKSLQGMDVIKMLGTFKGPKTLEKTQKWQKDIVPLGQDFIANGFLKESTFDSDSQGVLYPLLNALATQPHRQY
jgi:hypothetical protein